MAMLVSGGVWRPGNFRYPKTCAIQDAMGITGQYLNNNVTGHRLEGGMVLLILLKQGRGLLYFMFVCHVSGQTIFHHPRFP